MYHFSVEKKHPINKSNHAYKRTNLTGVLKTGPVIKSMKVLGHWFIGQITESLVGSHD